MYKKMMMVLLLSVLWGCSTTQNPSDPYFPPSDVPNDNNKLANVPMAIVANFDRMDANESHIDVMMDKVQDHLGKYLTIMEDPNQANGLIYLWLRSERKFDQAQNADCWFVTMGSHAVRKETAQEYWRFQLATGERSGGRIIAPGCDYAGDPVGAHVASVENAAKAVARKIMREIGENSTIPETNEYVVKFVDIGGQREREKVRETIAYITDGRGSYAKELPGGSSSGAIVEYRLKWLKRGAQPEVINIIQESAEENQLVIKVVQSSPGVIVFSLFVEDDE